MVLGDAGLDRGGLDHPDAVADDRPGRSLVRRVKTYRPQPWVRRDALGHDGIVLGEPWEPAAVDVEREDAGQLRPHRARTIRFRRCRAHPVLVRIPGVHGDIRLYGATAPSEPCACPISALTVEWPSSAGKARRSTLPSEAPRYAAGVKPSRNRMLAASENRPRGVMTMAVIVSLRAW
jgi:hypothetical protein